MKTTCPNCGAPIEFRFDDSFVRVCDSCKSAVLRTDRGLETLGKLGDLMPIDSPLKLFAEGREPGAKSTFQLVGMAQLKHAAGGTWQEWYARGDDGWLWVSEAQGRFYLTRASTLPAPPWAQLSPGGKIALGGDTFTVSELSEATYVSARGEIPYRLVPSETFEYADLGDGSGKFATIDYGSEDDTSGEPTVYLGRQVTLAELGMAGGEDQPESVAKGATAAKLACPNCGGALELRAPDVTLRVRCPYCNALVSVASGNLAVIGLLDKKVSLSIPLGSKGDFGEGEMQVIGFVRRSALIDGSWYPFEEYLLYARAVGFRWLVCSDGHWSYVQPIATGAADSNGDVATYDGVTFKQFQVSTLRVDTVYGELYWEVKAGEAVQAQDYIAPPCMLSVEQIAGEINWSLSTYLTQGALQKAMPGVSLALPPPIGVAPNQVFKGHGYGLPMGLAYLALIVVGIGTCAKADDKIVTSENFTAPAGQPARPAATPDDPTPEQPGNVMFSQKFHLDGGKNIEFTTSATVNNTWLSAAIDLVNDGTGQVVSFDGNVEYYSGIDDGESWSEGDLSTTEMIGPQPGGDYLMRVESQHGGTGDLMLTVTVRQNLFRHKYFWLAFLIMSIPMLVMWWLGSSFKKRQWENSNTRASAWSGGGNDDDDDD